MIHYYFSEALGAISFEVLITAVDKYPADAITKSGCMTDY